MTSSIETVVQQLITKVEESQPYIDDLVGLVDDYKQQLEEKEAELHDANQQVADLKKQLEEKGTELLDAIGELDAHLSETAEMQQQITELKQQLDEKGTELQDLVKEREEFLSEKHQAVQQLAGETSELKLLQDEVLLMRRQIQQLQKDREMLFLDSEQKNKVSALKLEDLNSQLSETTRQLNLATQDGDSLSLQLSQIQDEFEHYCELSQQQGQLLDSYSGLMNRLFVLMSGSLTDSIVHKTSSLKLVGMSIQHTIVERSKPHDNHNV